MQIEDWPVCRTGEFLAAYQLDFDGPKTVTVRAGVESNLQAAGIATIWGVAGRRSDARMMVLKTPDRSWTAAGAVMVEGRPGLNIGLVVPSLREVPNLPAGVVTLPRHKAPLERTLWALATRLDRVETRRLFVLESGDLFRIAAGRDGFRLDSGRSIDDLRRALGDEVQSGRSPRYTLAAEELRDPGPLHPATSLLTGEHDGDDIVLTETSWPAKIPLGVRMGDLKLAIAVVQRLQAAGCDDGSRLQVLDSSGSALLAVSREEMVWRVSVLRPGV
jgi:hypothetical protein